MSDEIKVPELESESTKAIDTSETKHVSIKDLPIAETKEPKSDKSIPVRSLSPSGGMPKISSKPPSHFNTGEAIQLTEEEKKAAQKSYAYTFDKMIEASLALVQSSQHLIKMCYLLLSAQLILIIILFYTTLKK